MQNIFIDLLPPWIETGLQPAFYDKESGTVLQQTARMYAKVNYLVEMFNKFTKDTSDYVNEFVDDTNAEIQRFEHDTNETVNDYIEKFNTLKDFVDDYFDNLDVQEEINNKLDEMVEDGVLQPIIYEYLNSVAIFCYDTVAGMKSATNFINGSYAKTLGYRSIYDGGGALYKIRTKTGDDVIDEGSLIALSDNTLVAELSEKEVNPVMFGAYGDNTHNDYDYFKNCFDYANANKLNIVLVPKTYKVSGNRLTLKTNLIGNSAVIVSDDTEAGINLDEPIIHVVSDSEFTSTVLPNAYIFRTYPDHSNIWKRSGNTPEAEAGITPQECNVAIKGTLLYNYFFDFSDPVTEYRALDHEIVIKDVIIDKTVVNSDRTSYIKRNIMIERDNVLLDSIVFKLTDNNTNTAPYLGLVKLNKCYNVRLDNCVIPAMLTNSSYAFHTSYDVKTTVNNCYLNGEYSCWGATSSNGAVDITYSKCNTNRIDAHEGFFGITVKDCYIGKEGIVLTGGVYALIENCHFNGRRCIALREDYGSGFNGTITMKNCDGIVTNQEIMYMKSDTDFDYGYTWKCPSIIIEDCQINASTGNITVFNFTVDSDSDLSWYGVRNNIKVVNLYSNRNLRLFNCLPHLFGDCEITLENLYIRNTFYTTYVASATNYNIFVNANKCTIRFPKDNTTKRINGMYIDCEMLDLEFAHLLTCISGGKLTSRDSVTPGYINDGKHFSMFNFGNLITEASVSAWHENCFNFQV